jgi:extradiol dioxygenase family protein
LGGADLGATHVLPADAIGIACFEAVERRKRACDGPLKGHHIHARRVAQPAASAVVEQQIPLVPHAGFIAQLDPANDIECARTLAARGADLDRRIVLEYRGHLAEVLYIAFCLEHGGLAKLAHRHDGGMRAELNGRAAARAGD